MSSSGEGNRSEYMLALASQIRVVREELGLSQAAFAKQIGYSRSHVANAEGGREISRALLEAIREIHEPFAPYVKEYDEKKPQASNSKRSVENDSVSEMFLARSSTVSAISGTWHALWQTTVNGVEVLNTEQLNIESLSRGRMKISNGAISPENPEGGYLWVSECRLFDNQYILGSYIAVDKAVRSKGTMQLTVHRSGKFIEGQWIGCNYDSDFAYGLVVFAREPEQLHARMELLRTNLRSLVK